MASEKPIPLPHILCFSTLRNWLRLLFRYGRQFDRRRLPQVIGITIFIILTLPVRLLESLLFSRKIRKHRFSEPPVFIVGHWRSGTTNMHNHLLQDPQFASVTLLHCSIPAGFLTWGWLARLIMNRRLPKSRPMDAVPLGIDEPMSEDFALAGLTHMSHYLNYFFPRIAEQTFRQTVLFEGASEDDIRHWGDSYDFLLRKVSFASNGKQLLLKNPPNVGRIPEVLKRYPDAKFIHVYRNPWTVHASTLKLTERFLKQMSFQDCPADKVEEFVTNRYQQIMARWLQDKSLIPPQNLIEVQHEAFIRNPMYQMRVIYRQLRLRSLDQDQERLQRYVKSLEGYRNNEYQFDGDYLERVSPGLSSFAAHAGYERPADHKAN